MNKKTKFTIIFSPFFYLSLLLSYNCSAQDHHFINPSRTPNNKEIYTKILPNSGLVKVVVDLIDGEQVYQGDIVIKKSGSGGRGGVHSVNSRWNNSCIKYKIEKGHPHSDLIRKACAKITKSTNLCVCEDNSIRWWHDYIYFESTNSKDYCGLSYVGKIGGKQWIKLSLSQKGCGANSTEKIGIIMHEVLHAAGFYHEHSRADRDNYIAINKFNIPISNWNNFEKVNKLKCGWFQCTFPDYTFEPTPYDYESIMHYGSYAAAISSDVPTITSKIPGKKFGQRTHLSSNDIKSINAAYPKSCNCTTGRGGLTSDTKVANISIDNYAVELVAQPTQLSSWVAGATMLVGWRDEVVINLEDIINGKEYWSQFRLKDGQLPPSDTTMFNYWGLVAETPRSYTVQELADLLMEYGPLWVASAESIIDKNAKDVHIRVIIGMEGDGTAEGTILSICDPWQRGMRRFRMPNPGSIYTESFVEFIKKQEELAGKEAKNKNVLLVVHP
jgi:hypothetical protein